MIVAENLTVYFAQWGEKTTALKNVSLTVPKGQWLMLTGPNGSGKTTLLKVFAGLQTLDEGCINKFVCNNTSFMSELFMVHQQPLDGTAELLTLKENLVVALPDAITNDDLFITNILKKLGMKEQKEQLLRDFSGGQRQLVALAIALARKPEVLLLDEPFSALDSQKVDLAISFLKEMHAGGTTIVQVSHNIEHIEKLAQRSIRLGNGYITEDITYECE